MKKSILALNLTGANIVLLSRLSVAWLDTKKDTLNVNLSRANSVQLNTLQKDISPTFIVINAHPFSLQRCHFAGI